jgi:predicted Fe-Mo cluster-binding NifX family protein
MIAISSTGNKLSSLMDMRFAKCSYFCFLKEEGPVFLANIYKEEDGHIAPTVVNWLKEQGVVQVITGEIGFTAQKSLKEAHIQAVLIENDKYTVRDILKKIR